MKRSLFSLYDWHVLVSNAFNLFISLAISITLTTQTSAQLLDPGTDNSEIQVEEISNPEALINVFLDCRGCREGFI